MQSVLRKTGAVGLSEHLETLRGALLNFAPVLFGIGIALYFAMAKEPAVLTLAACGGLGAGLLVISLRRAALVACTLVAPALVLLGFSWAGYEAHRKAAPVLEYLYYGPIEGRVFGIDRSASDAVRLTLDRVSLSRVAPSKTPKHVRVSLHGPDQPEIPPGTFVMLTGHLSPPGGAVEPGGFDFRRHAWFQSLGGVGYTRTQVMTWKPAGAGQVVFRARLGLSRRIQGAMPGEKGAFAAAILTGDRSGIAQQTLRNLRRSNLAHLLAISGLHMGLLAGFVFASLRLLLVIAAPQLPAKKLAAIGALVMAAGYLALSGGNVATERAFIMAAVALIAILADRRALSLRAVALAAMIVLILRPHALLGPGFQMSFAATTALVAVFSALRDQRRITLPDWLRPISGLILSSAVAGLTTAPFAAAHFNIFANFGLIANLASVPLMGAVVIPAGVIAILLMPFGLEGPALWVMGQGTGWILGVADKVANWPGAVRPVVSPDPGVLAAIALGGLCIALWPGRGRWIGAAPVLAGFVMWGQVERPHILIAETGKLVGVMTQEGRALTRAKGAGFIAGIWLENDGDAADQFGAARRMEQVRAWEKRAGLRLMHFSGKRDWAGFMGCAPDDILVSGVPVPEALPALPCRVFDSTRLGLAGSVALDRKGDVIATARAISGARLWSVKPKRDAEAPRLAQRRAVR